VRPSALTVLVLVAALLGPPALALRALPPADPADLVFVSGPEPETLDPAVAARVVDLRIVSALHEPLVALDPGTLAPRPALAASWTADARGVTFTLREELRFSNGDPLSADDVVRSWRRAADPATGAPMQAEAAAVAAGARAVDARTVRVEPHSPRPDLLPLLSLPAFAPVHATAVAAHGERWTRPEHWVGNGPYALAAWEPGRRIRMVRNPFHRDAGSIAIASIEALTTSGGGAGEAAAAFRVYETGAADLSFAVPARAAAALRAAGRTDLDERAGAGTYFLRFNTTRPPLDDAAVRRALSGAIDRAGICADVLRGGEEPAFSLVPPGIAGYRLDAADEARRAPQGRSDADLLDARAGVDAGAALRRIAERRREEDAPARAALSGRALELLYPASDDAAALVGEVLQEAWGRRFGLALRLRPSEPKTAFASVKRLEYDIAWGSWIADYPDAGAFLAILRSSSGNNRTGWSHEVYDDLLDACARSTGEDRAEGLIGAELVILTDAPIAPLFRTRAAALVRPGLEGAAALPFAHTLPWARLRWKDGRRP
jgi:oligopeptide transport system substrate-binding protein